MRAVLGGLLYPAGCAGVCAGFGEPAGPQSWALLGGGIIVLGIGFALACAGRGTASRASVAFILHVGGSIVTTAAFYRRPVAPLAAALALQMVLGLVLLPCVIEARRRVGSIFKTSLAIYVAMLGGSIYAAAKVL